MKIKNMTLLGVLTLLLMSCGGQTPGSSQVPSEPTSEIQPSETTTIAKPSDTTSEIPSSSEEILSNRGWSDLDAEHQRRILNGYVMPYVDIPNSNWEYFEPYDGIALTMERCEDNNIITSFADALYADGFKNVDDQMDDSNIWNRYGIKYLENSEMHEYLWFNAHRNMSSRKFYGILGYHIDNRNYNKVDIDAICNHIFNGAISIPAPTFAYEDYIFDINQEGGNVVLNFYGVDASALEMYTNALVNEGYLKRVDDFGSTLYFDIELTIDIEPTYDPVERYLRVSIMNCHADWTFKDKALMKKHLNNNLVPYFPIPEGSWTYDEQNQTLAFYKANASQNELDVVDYYLLSANYQDVSDNFIHEEGERIYFISLEQKELNEAIVISVFIDPSDKALNVYAEYQIDDPTWHGEEIKQAMHDAFLIDYSIPEPNFKFEHFSMDSDPLNGQIEIFLYGENHCQDYINQLLTDNFQEKQGYAGLFSDDNKVYVVVTYFQPYSYLYINLLRVSE